MDVESAKKMMFHVCDVLLSNEKRLCELDSVVGDGDHGVTISRGFGAVKEELQNNDYTKPSDMFKAIGTTLSKNLGGALGPIMGAIFSAGATKLGDRTDFDSNDFYILFSEGLKRVKSLGGAAEGDCTLVDALSPAVVALEASKGSTLEEAFKSACEASEAGSESTAQMKAKMGRAKYLGDKSIGHIDAGSVTMSLIFFAMYEYIKSNGEEK